jgi:hypothetical protein
MPLGNFSTGRRQRPRSVHGTFGSGSVPKGLDTQLGADLQSELSTSSRRRCARRAGLWCPTARSFGGLEGSGHSPRWGRSVWVLDNDATKTVALVPEQYRWLYEGSTGALFAIRVLIAMHLLALYLVVQRCFVARLMEGALKGWA